VTTSCAVKRRLRGHASAPPPSIEPITAVDELDDEDRRLLAWFDQATTDDPILVNVKRIIARGEELSAFHWRHIGRARDVAALTRYRYGSSTLRRQARLARKQEEVAQRRTGKPDPDSEDDPELTETL
jgi:hypothetical protein